MCIIAVFDSFFAGSYFGTSEIVKRNINDAKKMFLCLSWVSDK